MHIILAYIINRELSRSFLYQILESRVWNIMLKLFLFDI